MTPDLDVHRQHPHQVRGLLDAVKWLAIGTVGTLLLAEIGFRVLGPLFDASGSGAAGGAYTILCEGDSFTYGIGGRSFPQQIEAVVAERAGGLAVRSVNEGIPGLTTAMVADRLEEHIVASRPDYVVVVIGENNSWNSLPVASGRTDWSRMMERWLLHSRVYKFYKVVTIGWRHNTFHEAAGTGTDAPRIEVKESPENIGLLFEGEQSPNVYFPPTDKPGEMEAFMAIVGLAEAGRYEEAVPLAEAWVDRNPDRPGGYVILASSLVRQGRIDEAITRLTVGLTTPKDPFHEELYFQLGHARRKAGDVPKARETWLQGLGVFPGSRALYWSLARSLYDERRAFEVLTLVDGIAGIEDNPMHKALRDISQATEGQELSSAVSQAFEADIARMIGIARLHGVPILFSSYPDAIYPEVQEVAEREGAPFIDLRPHFRERFQSREDYISPDRCHCNTAGYRLMAELFVDEMSKTIPALSGGDRAP